MSENIQKNRILHQYLPDVSQNMLVLITGARQTGKTTSVKKQFSELTYFNLDSLEIREHLSKISSFSWGTAVGNAVLDEIQKEPGLLEKIKYAFDEKNITFSALLGSAQILLMKKVRESLAGRIFIYELWPLTLSELLCDGERKIEPAAVLEIMKEKSVETVCMRLASSAYMPGKSDNARQWEDYLLQWGGMPALLKLDDIKKWEWVRSYELTYLERDLGDLARINDLGPFRTFHKLAALRSGSILSYSSLSAEAAVSIETARRYIEYLKLSYQAFLLPPYYANMTSTVVKTPKVYWTDIGLWRHLSGQKEGISGQVFENHVIGEIYKHIKTAGLDARMFFYRTRSGMEVDALVEIPAGIIGIEIKSAKTAGPSDAKNLNALAEHFKGKWLGGIVAYRGDDIFKLSGSTWAVPSYKLLS